MSNVDTTTVAAPAAPAATSLAAAAAATPAPAPEAPAKTGPSLVGDVPARLPDANDPAAPKPDAGITSFDGKLIKMPEGFTPDDKLMGSFSELLNDSKLSSQDRGQKLIDLYAGAVKQVGEANTKAWADLNQQWIAEVKADSEIGGANFDSTRQVIAKAIDMLGPDRAGAFREALNVTGAGNHPGLIRGFAHLAKLLTEGSHINGDPPKRSGDLASIFFPNSPEMQKKG